MRVRDKAGSGPGSGPGSESGCGCGLWATARTGAHQRGTARGHREQPQVEDVGGEEGRACLGFGFGLGLELGSGLGRGLRLGLGLV